MAEAHLSMLGNAAEDAGGKKQVSRVLKRKIEVATR